MLIAYNEAMVKNVASKGVKEVLVIENVSEHTNILSGFRTVQYEVGGKYRDSSTREDVDVGATRVLMAIVPLGHNTVSGEMGATFNNPPKGKTDTDHHIIHTDVTPEEFLTVFKQARDETVAGKPFVIDITADNLIAQKIRKPAGPRLAVA